MSEPFDFTKLKDGVNAANGPLADPIPANSTKDKQPAKKAAPTRPVGRPTKESAMSTAAKEMQEEIEGFLLLLGMALTSRDQHPDGESCGDMFISFDPDKLEIQVTPETRAFAIAFAKVGVENKYIRKFFEAGDGAAKWIQLALATQPFIVGIAAAHVRQKQPSNA